MKEKIYYHTVIVLLVILSLVLAWTVDELKFQLEVFPIKYEIVKCLNSKEAKALEKWNENVERAINERRIQEAGICSDER